MKPNEMKGFKVVLQEVVEPNSGIVVCKQEICVYIYEGEIFVIEEGKSFLLGDNNKIIDSLTTGGTPQKIQQGLPLKFVSTLELKEHGFVEGLLYTSLKEEAEGGWKSTLCYNQLEARITISSLWEFVVEISTANSVRRILDYPFTQSEEVKTETTPIKRPSEVVSGGGILF